MALLALITRLLGLLLRTLDLIAPPACAACDLPGDSLCLACREALVAPPEPLCERCGHPQPLPVERCPECPATLMAARQAVLYVGPAPALVGALKDGRRRALAAVLAEEMAQRLRRPPDDAALVPVPIGRRRRATRGFNQSALIAAALGARWSLPVADVLARVVEGAPQRGSSATERARGVSGAFVVRVGAQVPPAPWLVDDVHTTGATLAACARALRMAGARRVGAVAFARAVALSPEMARAARSEAARPPPPEGPDKGLGAPG